MNIFKKEVPVDLDQIERDVTQHLRNVTASGGTVGPEQYATKQQKQYTPLQVIGHAITKLTWADAEEMGKAISDRMEDNKLGLTAAIQNWADDWESFPDD